MKRKTCMVAALLVVLTAGEVRAKEGAVEPLLVQVAKGVDVTLYGKVKMDVVYDTAQFRYYNDFIGTVSNRWTRKEELFADPVTGKVSPKVSLVPQDNGKDSTNFNPRDTRFGLMAKSAMGDWLVAGRIETDFYGAENGNNLIPRLRLGYVDIGYTPWKLRVLAGQDWIPISQGNPNMAEFGILAASGNLWWRVPQVTVRKGLGTHWEVLASVMKHRRTNTANNDIMPWFLGRLAYTFAVSSLNGMLAVGGGWRDADYGTGSNPLDHTERWLITEEMRLTWGSFVLQGEFWYGDGLGGEWLRYDLDVNPATQKPIRAIGGWGDLTWNITSKLSVTAGYGIDDPADNEMMAGRTARELNDRQFTRNQSIYGNFFYRIASPVRVGVEIVHVDTQRTNTTDSGWRFNTVAELVF